MSFILESSRASIGPNQGQQKLAYSFPLLKGHEILSVLHELNIPLTQEELTKPEKHVESIRRMFEQLVEYCTGTTREEMSQPVFSGLNALNYPQLHENSIPELALLRHTSRMMAICGVKNFCMKDLTAPTCKRLRRQLSAAINFCKFREERAAVYADLARTKQEIFDGLAKAQEEQKALQRQLAELEERTAAEGEQIATLEGEAKELEGEIGKLNQTQAALASESKGLKQAGNALKDKLNEAALALQQGEAQRTALRAQVVSSPARIRREMAATASALEAERAEGAAEAARARATEGARRRAEGAAGAAAALVARLAEIEKETEKYKAAAADVAGARERVAANRERVREAEEERGNEERATARCEEKLKVLREGTKAKSDEVCEKMELLRAELMKVEKERRDAMLNAESSEAEVLRLTQTLANERNKSEAELSEMVQTFQRIRTAVLRHHRELVTTIKDDSVRSSTAKPQSGAAGHDHEGQSSSNKENHVSKIIMKVAPTSEANCSISSQLQMSSLFSPSVL